MKSNAGCWRRRLAVLVEVAEVDRQGGAIATQRFAMTTVPMTVSSTYDPQIVDGGPWYGVFAAILAPDGQQIFRAIKTLGVPEGSVLGSVDIVLTMVPETDGAAAAPRRSAGVAWSVKEVFGETWQNDDPATFVIEDEMNFSIFGGCNRFSGQLAASGRGLAFPENIAGTMMACPDEIEALERRFLAAIMQVSDYVRYGTGLIMTDADGRAVLHFVETSELPGQPFISDRANAGAL